MEFSENIVLGGSKRECCEYGSTTGILCWVYDVLGDHYLTCLSGLTSSEADYRAGDPCSLPRRGDLHFHIVKHLSKSKGADAKELIWFFSGWEFFIC